MTPLSARLRFRQARFRLWSFRSHIRQDIGAPVSAYSVAWNDHPSFWMTRQLLSTDPSVSCCILSDMADCESARKRRLFALTVLEMARISPSKLLLRAHQALEDITANLCFPVRPESWCVLSQQTLEGTIYVLVRRAVSCTACSHVWLSSDPAGLVSGRVRLMSLNNFQKKTIAGIITCTIQLRMKKN